MCGQRSVVCVNVRSRERTCGVAQLSVYKSVCCFGNVPRTCPVAEPLCPWAKEGAVAQYWFCLGKFAFMREGTFPQNSPDEAAARCQFYSDGAKRLNMTKMREHRQTLTTASVSVRSMECVQWRKPQFCCWNVVLSHWRIQRQCVDLRLHEQTHRFCTRRFCLENTHRQN